MKIQHSEGTGTSSCLVMNYQIDKKQKQTNRLMSKSTTVLFLLQSLLLLKFSLFCFVLSFFFFWRYFIQCSFALYSSLSVSLDSLLYQLLLRQCSITVHIRRSTDLLFMIVWCTFHSPEGFAQRVPLSGIRCNKG